MFLVFYSNIFTKFFFNYFFLTSSTCYIVLLVLLVLLNSSCFCWQFLLFFVIWKNLYYSFEQNQQQPKVDSKKKTYHYRPTHKLNQSIHLSIQNKNKIVHFKCGLACYVAPLCYREIDKKWICKKKTKMIWNSNHAFCRECQQVTFLFLSSSFFDTQTIDPALFGPSSFFCSFWEIDKIRTCEIEKPTSQSNQIQVSIAWRKMG